MSKQLTENGDEEFSGISFIFSFISQSMKFLSWVLALSITSLGVLLGFDEQYVSEHKIKVELQKYVAWMENELMGSWREGESFKRQLRRAPIPKTDPVRQLHSELYFNWVEGVTIVHENWWEYVSATRPIRNMEDQSGVSDETERWVGGGPSLLDKLGPDFEIAMDRLQRYCSKSKDFNRYNGYYTKLTKLCMKYDVSLNHALWEPWKTAN